MSEDIVFVPCLLHITAHTYAAPQIHISLKSRTQKGATSSSKVHRESETNPTVRCNHTRDVAQRGGSPVADSRFATWVLSCGALSARVAATSMRCCSLFISINRGTFMASSVTPQQVIGFVNWTASYGYEAPACMRTVPRFPKCSLFFRSTVTSD